jgi:hypothetical protein
MFCIENLAFSGILGLAQWFSILGNIIEKKRFIWLLQDMTQEQ